MGVSAESSGECTELRLETPEASWRSAGLSVPLESRMAGAVGQHYQEHRLPVPCRVRECIHAQSLSHVRPFVAHQAPLSVGFPRQESWSGLPFNFPRVSVSPPLILTLPWLLSRVRLSVTPWTVACQTPLPMGFSRQEYCSGLPFPSPGDLLDPGRGNQVSCIVGRFFTN